MRIEDVRRRDQTRLPTTMGQAIVAFFRFPSPVIISFLTAGFLAARVAVGDWSWWDLGIVAVIAASWPYIEWVLHVSSLHAKPRHIGKLKIDLPVARQHRRHHRNPYQLEELFIPKHIVAITPFFFAALWSGIMPDAALALTGVTFSFVMTLRYEWYHYLIHTRYVPKGWWYKKLWLNHRLHHFKNEKLWYGVSTISADWVLHTAPDPSGVPASPTCKSLGVSTAGDPA